MAEEEDRSIVETLEELGGGEVLSATEKELQQVVRAVRETRKQGTVNISIKVKPNGEEAVMLESKVEGKPPVKPLPETSFYADRQGNLGRRPPEQQDLVEHAREAPQPNRNNVRSIT